MKTCFIYMCLLEFRFKSSPPLSFSSCLTLRFIFKSFLIYTQANVYFHWKILGIRKQSDDEMSIHLAAL